MAKPGTAERKARLLELLKEQRHLLRKSIAAMADGDLAEAIRVATITRVLVHESGSSKPLLKQLDQDYLQLHILDRPAPNPGALFSIPISITLRAEGAFLNPVIARENFSNSIIGSWWERPSLILLALGGFSRKQLVLGLANKEGGAHVDLDVSQRYQQLLDYKSFQMGWNEESTDPVKISRLIVGQTGVELLDCLDHNFP